MASEDDSADSSPLSSISSSILSVPKPPDSPPPAQETIQVAQHRPKYSSPPESPSPPNGMGRGPWRERRTPTPSEVSAAQKKRTHGAAFRKLAAPAAVRKKAKAADKFNPRTVLTSTKSPLAGADIRAILLQDAAWDVLDAADRQAILRLLPAAGTAAARPDAAALRNDDAFRNDCVRYAEALADGVHDREWLLQAFAAHELRAAGEFDDFLGRRFEESWDVALPAAMQPAAMRKAADDAAAAAEQAEGKGAAEENGPSEANGDAGEREAADGKGKEPVSVPVPAGVTEGKEQKSDSTPAA